MTSVAVIGAGYWGKNLVRNFANLGALGAICDPDLRVRASLGQYRIVDSFDAVLEDASLTCVAIASPAAMHFDMTRAALEAQKHVFVEKPLALNVEQGTELRDLAAKVDRTLMVGHLLQYHPAVIKLQELVSSGELGKVRYIYSNRLNLGKIRREENILWSFAPHDISVILSLTSEMPASVVCTSATYLQTEVADVTLSSLTFASQIRAHVFVSWLHPNKEQRLVVVGDRKMAVFNDVEPFDKLLLFAHKIEWNGHVPVPNKEEAERVEYDANKEPLAEECAHFLDCVQTGQRPKTDAEEALRVLRVLHACQRSMEADGQRTVV